MNVLPKTVSEGHASWHATFRPRTKQEIDNKSRRNRNMRLMQSMKIIMKVHNLECDGSGLMLDSNKKKESIFNPSYSMIHAL